MFNNIFSSNRRVDDWPLWFCIALICIAPFLSLYRVGPLSSFYLENGSLAAALLLVFLSAFYGVLNVRLPATAVYFLVLAAGLWLQARLMGLIYPGFSDMTVWTFIILALTAWACRGWVAELGQDRVVAVLAWALLIGALLQAAVAVMQFTGWAAWPPLRGIVAYRGLREVSGQLGQRNHLGHYLMWGILAASYLWSQRRLPLWGGLLSVVALTAALALVNSRTIFTYVAAVGLLLPLWRLRAGREANRTVLLMGLALALTVFMQYALNPVLAWFSHVQYDTALSRVERSTFAMSARDIEWRKAWIVFQTAPLWGHGWGSLSLQGFSTNIFPKVYSTHGLNVLFTHSHNLILQLLAETGIVGALAVVGGYLAAIWRMFRRPAGQASLLLLALMAVSLCHSLLEYPLWYIYFLVPFALMMSLSPADKQDLCYGLRGTVQNCAAAVMVLFLAVGIVRLTAVYTELAEFSRQKNSDTPADILQKTNGLIKISATEPMLRYYAQMSLAKRADPADPMPAQWAQEAAMQTQLFRPYANAYQRGFYLYRQGKTAEAQEWLRKTYEYYPNMLPFYRKKIYDSPYFEGLREQVDFHCRAYEEVNPKAKSCFSAQ